MFFIVHNRNERIIKGKTRVLEVINGEFLRLRNRTVLDDEHGNAQE